MTERPDETVLREHGVTPTAQRVAVAGYVLHTQDHPAAEEVWTRVREGCPSLSRATVYNTLNLFVGKGLLRQVTLDGGRVVFDANTADHHHFIDDDTGAIFDLPWNALRVERLSELGDFDVREYQVVLRGRRKTARPG